MPRHPLLEKSAHNHGRGKTCLWVCRATKVTTPATSGIKTARNVISTSACLSSLRALHSKRTREHAHLELLRHVGERDSPARFLRDLRGVWVAIVRLLGHRTRHRHLSRGEKKRVHEQPRFYKRTSAKEPPLPVSFEVCAA